WGSAANRTGWGEADAGFASQDALAGLRPPVGETGPRCRAGYLRGALRGNTRFASMPIPSHRVANKRALRVMMKNGQSRPGRLPQRLWEVDPASSPNLVDMSCPDSLPRTRKVLRFRRGLAGGYGRGVCIGFFRSDAVASRLESGSCREIPIPPVTGRAAESICWLAESYVSSPGIDQREGGDWV